MYQVHYAFVSSLNIHLILEDALVDGGGENWVTIKDQSKESKLYMYFV